MRDGTKLLRLRLILRSKKLLLLYIKRHIEKSLLSNVEWLKLKHRLLQQLRNVSKICLLLQRKQKEQKGRRAKRMRLHLKRLMRLQCQLLRQLQNRKSLISNTQYSLEKPCDKDIPDHSPLGQSNSKTSI